MSVINILSPHVADLIAAGEVVERPASVVKELVENSIDAGAKNITVEIRGGGMSLVSVTDDGAGMAPDDAGVAFLRHATSKLSGESGLESISTLGFRGEALAAISAVSHVELLTRRRGDGSGTRVLLDAGDIASMGPAGCPEGTAMYVRGLFYNTPARQKFMKSDRAESGACEMTALRCALGRPDVSVRMIKDGEERFFSPGDGRAKSAVYSLLGRENALGMAECSGENAGVRVSGFVSAPHAGRGNRAMQFFFINGRSFKSASIQAALEQAYRNTLLTGRFPACALYIELPFGKVDVNVHPTKQEVKFSDEKAVFDAVYFSVLSAIGSERQPAEIKLAPDTAAPAPRPDLYKSMTSREYRGSAAPAARGTQTSLPLRQSAPEYAASPLVPRPEIPRLQSEARPVPERAAEPAPPVPDFRVVGEAMDTYIIVETGGDLLLIDKHAAHERMIFDRLKAAGGEVMSQTLLVPVTCTPGAETVELLAQNSELLDRAGFEIEPYGDESVVIRAVPADTEGGEAAMLEELAEKLRGRPVPERRDAILHTIACKAAIKAGMRTDDAERRAIAARVVSGEIRYCPHGRPVSVRLTKKELDRQFKRIV